MAGMELPRCRLGAQATRPNPLCRGKLRGASMFMVSGLRVAWGWRSAVPGLRPARENSQKPSDAAGRARRQTQSAVPEAAAESLDWGRQRAELWAEMEKRRNREEKGYRGLAREERSDSLGERLLGEEPRRVLREIRQLGKERRWAEALLLLRAEADPAPALRTAAMNACAKALELEQARAVFDEMPEKTVAAYNVLVWMVGLRDPAGAERLVEEMPKQALRPDAGIFRSLIDTHGKAGDLKAAMRVFSQSRGDGIPPSTSTYQVLLSACTRAGDPDCAEELLADIGGAAPAGRRPLVEPGGLLLAGQGRGEGTGCLRGHARRRGGARRRGLHRSDLVLRGRGGLREGPGGLRGNAQRRRVPRHVRVQRSPRHRRHGGRRGAF
ncbi:unnamed protein product [Prorocentrum cordatum]|uniref:Pentacotripeptide-repeat region of PRORP domain-containing protein n=1 Tax=Prorocentrum cordatum TaxID=2364126 RepID=A0ABN9UJI2_9DINO|nr:unnamed protein product [Polarella glacialis]